MFEPEPKILPRNVAAMRVGAQPLDVPVRVTGNPAAALLESGVGNCFPGLECDLRNLERRFFPLLEVETNFGSLFIVSVDQAGVTAAAAAGMITAEIAHGYQQIADDIAASGANWTIERMGGDFGPLGMLDFALGDLGNGSFGPGRLPSDAWTAVRLLKENEVVRLTARSALGTQIVLTGRRARYLDPNGALSRIFEIGELTQSLCSPWTHDFRDCGCYYWASNHPDIALPPESGTTETSPNRNLATPWLRSDRSMTDPPLADGARPQAGDEIAYHRINRDWQDLNFVLERREQIAPYQERETSIAPFPDLVTLITELRYAAGVELAIMQEYLAAAASLKRSEGQSEPLRGDLRVSYSELMRIAIGEMRHLRAVNDVLRALSPVGSFVPALRVAEEVPLAPGSLRVRASRPLTHALLQEFTDIEAPSQSVDSLYARILATIDAMGSHDDSAQTIRTVMAEGEDHWQTFRFMQVWLAPHAEADYLRASAVAASTLPAQRTFMAAYVALLEKLHDGYATGLPGGAPQVNAARASMLGGTGMQGLIEQVAVLGFVPNFELIADPRFTDLPRP